MKLKNLLKLLLVASIVFVLLNDVFLSDVPELFNYGYEFGQVLSNLFLAYIASYIFYFIVVVLKDRRDKENIYLYVYELTRNLIGRAYSVYNEIIAASGVNQKDYDKRTITLEQYKELCKKANPNETPSNRGIGQPISEKATYAKFIYNGSVAYVKHYIEKIFIYMPLLDSEHVRLINRLQNSEFFKEADTLTWQSLNSNFSVYSDNMYEFLEFVRDLEDYNERENIKHIKSNKTYRKQQ